MGKSVTRQEKTLTAEDIQRLLSVVNTQEEKIQQLEHQLAWFKKQLFGQKTEKRDYADNPFQTTIADVLGEVALPEKPSDEPKETITYQRGKAKKNVLAGSPDDSGLRFSDTVPVEEISLPAPELEGEHKDDYEIIGYKTTYRLAQNPSSYVVIKYTTRSSNISPLNP